MMKRFPDDADPKPAIGLAGCVMAFL